MRRLPVYILIDTSGSMKGEPIESVKVGLEAMVSSLRQDPFALESACISIITFDKDVNCILPLTPLEELKLPEIIISESNSAEFAHAMQILCERIKQEVSRCTPEKKGDWRPLLLVFSSGIFSDVEIFEPLKCIFDRNFWDVSIIASESSVEYISQIGRDVFNLSKVDKITIPFPSYGQISWYISGEKLYEPKPNADVCMNETSLPPIPDELKKFLFES